MSSALSKQVRRIETAIALLGNFYDRLRYLQPPMTRLVEGAAELEQFSDTTYLLRCGALMREGNNFPVSWRRAVGESEREIGTPLAEVLLEVGGVLGSTDLDGQLAAIRHAQALLENRLSDARTDRERRGKLYSSLGVLGGVAFVVVLL